MKGAIIGDIAGSAYEFNNTFNYNFEMFGQDASFTDDTICTIATADAILKSESFESSTLKWCSRFPHPKGAYGASFAMWLRDSNRHPYNSFGNGAAMRVSPIGLYYGLEEIEQKAYASAAFTHDHPEGIAGAVSIARAIQALRNTKNKKAAANIAEYYYPGFGSMKFKRGKFDETCQYCVPLAFNIFLASTSFEDAIRLAVCFGGDSDTLGAIVGGLAEAFYGVPGALWEKAEEFINDDMKVVVREFYKKITT